MGIVVFDLGGLRGLHGSGRIMLGKIILGVFILMAAIVLAQPQYAAPAWAFAINVLIGLFWFFAAVATFAIVMILVTIFYYKKR